MADMEYDAYQASNGPEAVGVLARLMNWVGAASSIALVVGLGIWGYQLTMRDVSGVPVIRALEGPARIQPAEPGGQLAEHQGLAVNSVQAVGEASGPAPQVILAPEPIDLTQEDVLVAVTEAEPETETTETLASLVVEDEATPQDSVARDPIAEALALANRLADEDDPLEPLRPEADVSEVQLASASSSAIAASIPGVRRSPRPGFRPKRSIENLQQARAVAAAVPSVTEASLEVDPGTIAAGTRLVQLGAYDDPEIARAEWDKIARQFADYMDGKGRLIQEAKSGGRKFYRLRATGFEDLSASRRFCAVLVAANAACIPVLAR